MGIHQLVSMPKGGCRGLSRGLLSSHSSPPPPGGCNDPEVIRSIVDTCIWLGSIPGYTLSETSEGLVNMVMEDPDSVMGGKGGVVHFDRPILLPFNLDSYDGKYVTSPGRPGFPASVPPWSQADDKNIWIAF
jgi:hypothetical protein